MFGSDSGLIYFFFLCISKVFSHVVYTHIFPLDSFPGIKVHYHLESCDCDSPASIEHGTESSIDLDSIMNSN